VELVKLALEHNSGSIIIPKPRSMSLLNVAEAVCGGTSKIEITGPRAGEKRHEQLLHQQESVRARDLGPYYELLKVGSANISEPFILSSNTPEAGWFELDEFRDLIKEASCI
jgi:FlaA1/EpsC-like NDP-sugar epimerase